MSIVNAEGENVSKRTWTNSAASLWKYKFEQAIYIQFPGKQWPDKGAKIAWVSVDWSIWRRQVWHSQVTA